MPCRLLTRCSCRAPAHHLTTAHVPFWRLVCRSADIVPEVGEETPPNSIFHTDDKAKPELPYFFRVRQVPGPAWSFCFSSPMPGPASQCNTILVVCAPVPESRSNASLVLFRARPGLGSPSNTSLAFPTRLRPSPPPPQPQVSTSTGDDEKSGTWGMTRMLTEALRT